MAGHAKKEAEKKGAAQRNQHQIAKHFKSKPQTKSKKVTKSKPTSTNFRKEVMQVCCSPFDYSVKVEADKNEPFCSFCLLKPCFVFIKKEEIDKKWDALWHRNMHTHGFTYLPEEHKIRIFNKDMKEEVMKGVSEGMFSKKHIKMAGIPQCAVSFVDRAMPCTPAPVGQWCPRSANEAWEWLNRDEDWHTDESKSDSDSDADFLNQHEERVRWQG